MVCATGLEATTPGLPPSGCATAVDRMSYTRHHVMTGALWSSGVLVSGEHVTPRAAVCGGLSSRDRRRGDVVAGRRSCSLTAAVDVDCLC